MSSRSSLFAGILAGGLALSLVAAGTASADQRVGTATTSLLGAELQVTGLGDLPVVRVLDVSSLASTDPTAAVNPLSQPFATIGVVPIAVGTSQIGAMTARSDGQTSQTTVADSFGDALSPVGIDAAPVSLSAEATADRAVATADAALTQVTALLGQLGLDLDLTGVASLVNQDGAAASQGLQVSSLNLGLGDLGIDENVLGLLPLGDLLALLDQLPIDLPADLTSVVDGINQGLADLQSQLGDLAAAAAPLADATDQLGLITAALPDVQALDTLLSSLTALQGGDLTTLVTGLTGLLTDLDAAGCAVTLPAVPDLGSLTTILNDAITCVQSAITDTLASLTSQGVSGLDGVAPADALSTLTNLQTLLTDALPGLVDALASVLTQLVATLTDLSTSVNGLQDLLAQLGDLLPDIAGTDLLSVGAFDVGVSAIATDSLDTSSATVLCSATDVTVLGQSFSTPDCSQGLGALSSVSAAISDAIGQIADVLNALPLSDVVQVGDLKADVFDNLTKTVEQSGNTVTSTAGFDLLNLQVPSVTIDPSAISGDLLGGLALPDVLGTVTGVLTDVQTQLGDVAALPGAPDLTAVTSTVDGLVASLGDTGGISDLVGAITDLLGSLDLGTLGSLSEPVSTPGLRLSIDPQSSATFTVTPAPAPQPAPEPTPEPTPAPTPLPSTGGGAALLGVLAIGGALGLKRRRR